MTYIVIAERKDGRGDADMETAEDLQEARRLASMLWAHYTPQERRDRRITVAVAITGRDGDLLGLDEVAEVME